MAPAQGILSAKLVNRARDVILHPTSEWQAIDTESADIATLYRTYVMPLAAIGPLATFIGSALIGTTVPFLGTVRAPITNALVGAIVSFALELAGVYIVALVIDNLATTYGGTRSMPQAFKVAAYSSTAQWLAGIFALLPALGVLSILGLYSLYLLYVGLPILMKVPRERATSYTVAVVVFTLIVFVVIAAVTGAIVGTSVFFRM